MAVYNEEETLPKLLPKINNVVKMLQSIGVDEVIITIKDGNSTDKSLNILEKAVRSKPFYKLLTGPDNGKWSALRLAMQYTITDIYIVQDGDLEYNPYELVNIVKPILNNECDVCFGSRFINSGFEKPMKYINYIGNRLMSFLASIFSRHRISDINTCYKAWKRILKPIIRSDSYTGDIELAIELLNNPKVRYKEIPISYQPRTEGKKLKAIDGFKLWYALLKSLLSL